MNGKDLQYIRVSDERAILKRGTNELMLNGEGVHDILEPLMTLLERHLTREQILEAFDEDVRAEVDKFLGGLLSRRLISDSDDDTSSDVSLQSLQTAFWRNFGDAARGAQDRLRDASVVVVGATLISRAMVRSLLETGIGRVTLVDHPVLNNEIAPALFDCIGNERLTRLPELPPEDDLRNATILAAASDFGQADALLDINRVALRTNRPFLPVSLSELLGYIGPLAQPYESACLRCYRARTESNNPNYEAARAVRKHAAANPHVVMSSGLLPPMPAILGEVAASEITKFIAGFPPCDTVGRVIELNVISFGATVRRVLKIPRCPDCSDIMTRGTRAVTTGPLIPYSE